MKYWIVLLIAVLLGITRFFIPTQHQVDFTNVYKDVAHIFIGVLLGAWLVSKQKLYLLVFAALTIVEIIAFFTLK